MHDHRFRDPARAETSPRPPIEEAPPAVPGRSVAPSSGAGLPPDVRDRMEASFGMDLTAVRVHEGEEASAQGAVAYAQGADLHFAPGRYDPRSERGLALLGHELAHVAQHAEGRAPGRQAFGAGGDPALEAEADAMGERAARGERARPEGAPTLIARRDPAGAVQRMIDKAAPPNGSAWDVIERYLTRTLINNRKQTFEEAVTEFIATGVAGATAVDTAWRALVAIRGQHGQENAALAQIQNIRTSINDAKSDVPDHPNKRGIQPSGERYETIPQSQLSQQTAFALRDRLLTDLLGNVRTTSRFDPKKKRKVQRPATYLDPSDTKWKKIRGHWAEQFMLGVLVLPNGAIEVSHSGFMGTSQDAAFQHIVTAAGYTPRTYGDADYASLQDGYKTDAQQALHGVHGHSIQVDNRGKEKVTDGTEDGNPFGVCAAPQVIEPGRRLTGNFPTELTGTTQMALTEVWVSQNVNSRVEVHDVGGHSQRYSGNQDVPSCLTCQHQLRVVMRKLVDLRRNIVNRDQVRGNEEELDRYQLVEAVKELRDILGSEDLRNDLVRRITGEGDKESERTDGDLRALDDMIEKYLGAIDRQALERTKHPEHIEHDDKSTQTELKDLVKAEEATRTHHYEALWQKRVEVGRMLQPDVSRELSSDERATDRAYFVNLREERAQEALRDAQASSERREELERLQVAEEVEVLARASRGLQKLAYYQESGLLLGEEVEVVKLALQTHDETYRTATAAILMADPFDRGRLARLHDQLAAAMRGLARAVGDLDHRLELGMERVRTQRSEEALSAAIASSLQRGDTQSMDASDDAEDRLREQAQKAAEDSSNKREQAEAEYASQLHGLAMSLAMMYDTSLERQLQRLLEEDQGIAPPPPTDHSDEYIG